MARWKLTAKHYIHAEQYGQATEWAREETNKETGRTFRKTLIVPMLIDPEDPGCVNRFTGMCVVARKGTEQPGDIVFFGPPTMDMEPLDGEAQAETDKERPNWKSPLDELPITIGEDFGARLLASLERQFAAAQANAQGGGSASLKGASPSELDELKKMIALQQEQIAALMGKPAAEAPLPEPELDLPKAPPPTVAPPRQTAIRR